MCDTIKYIAAEEEEEDFLLERAKGKEGLDLMERRKKDWRKVRERNQDRSPHYLYTE